MTVELTVSPSELHAVESEAGSDAMEAEDLQEALRDMLQHDRNDQTGR